MKHINKKMLGLTILMLSLVLLVGCNQELGNLTIEVNDSNGQSLDTEVKLTRNDQVRNKKTTNGVVRFNEIPTGTYELEVSKDGYYTVDESVTLEEKNLTYKVNLEQKKFKLKINVTNQAGENLTATAELKGADTTKTITVTNGTAEITSLVPGEYQLTISKDGYQTSSKSLTINNQNLTTDLQLKEVESNQPVEENEEDKKTKEDKTKEKVKLQINILDINNNQLPATVKVEQNGAVIATDTADKINFNNLEPGSYTINISKENYQDWSKKVKLNDSKTTFTATLKGGSINQYWVNADQNRQTITVDELKDNEELIVAVAGLNWDNIKQENIYPVRNKENQLIEERGLNFANNERNYQVGDTKEFTIPQNVSKQEKVTAKLAKKGKNIYVFVAKDAYISKADLENLVTEFDRKIDPAITNKENIKERVTVLLTDFSDYQMTGYFDPADLYPNLGNEEPMFYVNSRRSGNTLLTSTAHQYQHFNFFIDKAKAGRIANDAWINQGIAQLAPQLLGYFNPDKEGWSPEKGNGWVYNQTLGYLNNTTEINLLLHDGSLPFTGAAGLFANYLLDTYNPRLIYNIITSADEPRKVIADYTGKSFSEIYLNWVTTNVTDSIAEIDSPIYNYTKFDLAKMPQFNKEQGNPQGVNYFKVNRNEFTIYPPEGFKGQLGIVVIRHKIN